MKKTSISAFLAVVLFGAPMVVCAAYPVYNNANGMYGRTMPVMANGAAMYNPNSYNSVVAAQPTRITGALPQVGSSRTVAGRQYYQPADYDRLADSGLYVGLSAGYSMSTMGSIAADYTAEEDAYTVPGAFQVADFLSDTIIPLQISVGAAINNDVRIDFSYLRYSGLSYPKTVQTADGAGLLCRSQ